MSSEPSNGSQLASPAYDLPAMDEHFLLSDAMRGVRFMMEFMKADEILRAWDIASTVVVFGSAQVSERGPRHHARWYGEARRFAEAASREGGALAEGRPRRNVIATGGGPGIMAAANRGAADAGAPSIGFNISLPRPQEPNAWSTPELTFCFHYFAMRKMHLAMRAAALVVFPGGFGTLDELFEILTLRQTGKMRPVPIVLVDAAYWRSLIDFDVLTSRGFVAPADLSLMEFAEDGLDAWRRLAGRLKGPGLV